MAASPFRRFLAAGFGAGLIPRRLWGSDNGAGTVGAVLAAVIAVALAPFPEYVHLGAIGVTLALSLWAPVPFLDTDAHGDPQWVAIDEVAGALIALTWLAGLPWVVAWAVFRAADIWKVLPGVAQAERLAGSLGVTADDVVAGLYGLAAGSLVALLF